MISKEFPELLPGGICLHHGKGKSLMEIKDSGTRQEFESGAVRDGEEKKGRFDLLPSVVFDMLKGPRGYSYHGWHRVARHFEEGAKKYEDRNWERGIPLHCFLDSGTRHFFKLLAGESDEDHAAAAVWNWVCLLETQNRIQAGLLPQELSDLNMVCYSFVSTNLHTSSLGAAVLALQEFYRSQSAAPLSRAIKWVVQYMDEEEVDAS